MNLNTTSFSSSVRAAYRKHDAITSFESTCHQKENRYCADILSRFEAFLPGMLAHIAFSVLCTFDCTSTLSCCCDRLVKAVPFRPPCWPEATSPPIMLRPSQRVLLLRLLIHSELKQHLIFLAVLSLPLNAVSLFSFKKEQALTCAPFRASLRLPWYLHRY